MTGSTVSRRAFGKFLRQIRESAGKTALAAGLHIEVSKATLLRLEDGIPTKIATSQLKDLLDFYGAAAEVRSDALSLWDEVKEQSKAQQQQGNSKGFWRPYADQYEAHFPHYLRLETAANRVTSHQLVMAPGLLQTPDYRRSVIRIDEPDLSAVDLERRIELTARRQARLDEPNFQLEVLLSEAVLRHQPASPDVMARQLLSLVDAGGRENISIRVIPFRVGPHQGLTVKSFTLLEFPRLDRGLVEPPVVYVEGASNTGVYHERNDVVDRYGRTISALRAVALNEQCTKDLLLQYAKEYAA
ncbi:helix-turn-helix domain-containing protein [Nocardia sp. SYP-A9097]|uniref:helix-turn-helix domain-containing protein n=1 Tax=Nocardia sp. SYP-A9097 TaxID=2663237 RepID=UPI00129B2046|nr:helix-turn-helix transcriptional regulator [Nocardia sp. SYP-A9097]MRH91501.1 helix-turn-helix domain-containing protein [Nocardia sp. SYP-A9097]